MTLHWWHHWFWITGPAPVVLMLLVVVPRCFCGEPWGAGAGVSRARTLLGFASLGPDPDPDTAHTYLTTSDLPERGPKAIGLAPPTPPPNKVSRLSTFSAAPFSPTTPSSVSLASSPLTSEQFITHGSSPRAVVEILEEVDRNGNGTELQEEVLTAETDTSPELRGEQPSSVATPLSSSESGGSDEMVNDEPARVSSESPVSSSPVPDTPVFSDSTFEPSPSTSAANVSRPLHATSVTVTAARQTTEPEPTGGVEVPVHPAVAVNTPTPSDSLSSTTVLVHSASDSELIPEDRAAAAAAVASLDASQGAPVGAHYGASKPHRGGSGLDAGSITGIVLGLVVFAGLVGTISFVLYRRRYLNKPQTLNDKCSNPDSSGYIDDSTLRENSEEMYSLDNDSFLNSLEAMTIQNYWTDSVKHTKL